MKNNYSLGQRIKELRIQRGLSQEQLALHSNITTVYLGLVERNAKNLTVAIIEKLCHSLDISLSEFFSTNEKTSNQFDTLSLQILNQIAGRTDIKKQIILRLIKQALKLCDIPSD